MRRFAALLLLGVLAVSGCVDTGGSAKETTRHPPLRVEVVADGLRHPWDVGFLPDGRALVSQRPGRLALLDKPAAHRPAVPAKPVQADFGDVHVRGEGGLMGLLVHPDFATNRLFLTCQTHQVGGQPIDIRVIKWRLSEDGASARRVGEPLLTGLPLNPSGRHSGCRPELGSDGSLLVSTGDAAQPTTAQNTRSLGGKVLRMDLNTGAALPGNPFFQSPHPRERLVYTYGHRNPQGIAARPGAQPMISEHGPDAEDEINRVSAGGNYGWAPARGPTTDTYDESVPMTDRERFPHAINPVWTSGRTTEAVCGAEFLHGPQWAELDGALAVTALRGSKLLLFLVGPGEQIRAVTIPAELNNTYGRLRAARQGPDGALYITTSNGLDDKVLRVSPGR